MRRERRAGLLACSGASRMFTTCKHTQAQKKILPEFFKAVFFVFVFEMSLNQSVERWFQGSKCPNMESYAIWVHTYVYSLCVPAFVIIHLLRLPTQRALLLGRFWHNQSLANWYKVSTWILPTNAARSPLLRALSRITAQNRSDHR